MDNKKFYSKLFAPVEKKIGRIDRESVVSIIGFDYGGPLNFCTVGRDSGAQFVTYISCELAIRDEQLPSGVGRYELMMTCSNENWCRSILSNIGRMTLGEAFSLGHTLDIEAWVGKRARIQGVIFEEFASVRIGRKQFGILSCHGVTRPELKFARENGGAALLLLLKKAGVYPMTDLKRKTIGLS